MAYGFLLQIENFSRPMLILFFLSMSMKSQTALPLYKTGLLFVPVLYLSGEENSQNQASKLEVLPFLFMRILDISDPLFRNFAHRNGTLLSPVSSRTRAGKLE